MNSWRAVVMVEHCRGLNFTVLVVVGIIRVKMSGKYGRGGSRNIIYRIINKTQKGVEVRWLVLIRV